MSAESIAGVAVMGMGLASTSITVQAAGNLMRQSQRMSRLSQPRRSRRQGRGLDISSVIFSSPKRGSKRRRR